MPARCSGFMYLFRFANLLTLVLILRRVVMCPRSVAGPACSPPSSSSLGRTDLTMDRVVHAQLSASGLVSVALTVTAHLELERRSSTCPI
jgi:hypothetical protein